MSTTLTPYDTGARLEPKPWPVATPTALDQISLDEIGLADELDRFGNVDFENDESATLVTIHVSKNPDGTHTVHVIPMTDEDEISVEFHGETVNGTLHP